MWLPAYVPHTGLDGLGTELQAYSCNCLLSYMLEYSRMIWMPTKTPEQMMCIYLLLVRDYFDRLWHQITPWCIYIYILQYRMHAVRPVVQIELASGFSQTWPYCSSAGVSFWFLLPLSNTAGSSCWKGHQSYATVQPRHGSSGQGTPLSPGVSVCEGGRASTSNL